MVVEKPQLLLVDDSAQDIHLLTEILGTQFSIGVATNGSKAIELCESSKVIPSVVLLDVLMPDLDGYETCKRLKQLSGLEQVEVIFVSGNGSIEEKTRGYDVGGADYLSKPVNPDELRQKVKLAVERHEARLAAESQSKSAMDAAMAAIMDAGEQGNVIHFLRDSFQCQSLQDLANAIATATSNFGLSNTVQIRTPWKTITVSSNGVVPPLEVEMLSSLKTIGRIHQRGKRLILNFDDISQLVKNLPEDDEAKCGRLRDHLALILEGAKSRAKALLAVSEMTNLLKETEEAISDIRINETAQKGRNIKIMDEMLEEIHAGLFEYGLTEEQENVLLAMVEKYSEKVFKAYEEGLKVDDKLHHVSETLNRSVLRFFSRHSE